jgi:hypothetical protein
MKLPLPFRARGSTTVVRAAEDRTEKLLAEGLRLLGQFCAKMADLIEAQRLQRAGYGEQDKFLERLDYSERHGNRPPEPINGRGGSSEAALEETSFDR